MRTVQIKVEKVQDLVRAELMAALVKFPPFKSEHEGYAIILEEVDELWEGIKDNKHTTREERMKEAVQVAAMAMRYVLDLGGLA